MGVDPENGDFALSSAQVAHLNAHVVHYSFHLGDDGVDGGSR